MRRFKAHFIAIWLGLVSRIASLLLTLAALAVILLYGNSERFKCYRLRDSLQEITGVDLNRCPCCHNGT